MKLQPTGSWINAVAMVHQRQSAIITPDDAKGTTRCYLIESVGPMVTGGYEVGDVVVAKSVFDLLFYNGNYHRVMFLEEEVVQKLEGVDLNEFVRIDGKTPATSVELGADIAPSPPIAAE